jgi:hypothetical protein
VQIIVDQTRYVSSRNCAASASGKFIADAGRLRQSDLSVDDREALVLQRLAQG